MPELRDTRWKNYDNALFFEIGITASGSGGETIKHGLEPFMTDYYWPLPGRDLGSISLFKTANMNINLEYNSRRIQENIVELYKSGGRFPIWMDCPYETIELAPPSQ